VSIEVRSVLPIGTRKHGRIRVWVGQWSENGGRRSKVLGRVGAMTSMEAQLALADIKVRGSACGPFPAGRLLCFCGPSTRKRRESRSYPTRSRGV
jgi:hypothetical protein